MEKDAAGYLSLLSHDRRTNPGTSRYLASRLPYISSGLIPIRSCQIATSETVMR